MRFSLIALVALASLSQADTIVGTPGHIKVELKTAKGWVELYQPAYKLQQTRQSLSVPVEMLAKGKLTLRLNAIDNDETQIDQLALEGGKLLSAKDLNTGQDLRAKLNKSDRDVAEVNGHVVEVVLSAPKGVQELNLILEARSSNNAAIPNTPFRLGAGAVKGARNCENGPISLEAVEGASVTLDPGVMSSSSGHPSAPMFGHLKVEGDRLKGHLNFGPDNDPGEDDYASIVAYDAKGKAKEFKVTFADQRYGKARWDYAPAPAASWQHMMFDLDVKLSELPRDSNGKLALEMLAYGTCAGGENANYYAASINSPAVTLPNDIIFSVTANNGGSGNGNAQTISFTAEIKNPYGVVVANLFNTGPFMCYSLPGTAAFTYTATCSGDYTITAYARGAVGDNTADPGLVQTVVVSGGSVCVSPSPSPTPSPTFTQSPTPVSAVPGGTPLTQATAPGVQVLTTSTTPGGTMTFVFPKVPSRMQVIVYTLAFEKVTELNASNANPQWKTSGVAPGIYLFNLKGTLSDGTNVDTWKKGAITFK